MLFRLEEHLERLYGSLEALEIDPGLSLDELLAVTEETLARNLPSEAGDMEWQTIHNLSAGPDPAFAAAFDTGAMRPTVVVSCFPLQSRLARLAPKYESGVDLVVPSQPAILPSLLPTHVKTRGRLHYLLAGLQAARAVPGAWAVLCDPAGRLTEGTNNNLFLVSAGRLKTPPVEWVLPGVTRAMVIELAAGLGLTVEEAELTAADALAAEEVFVTSTSIGILHARSFNGTLIGDGRCGRVTSQLRSALSDAVGIDFAAQASAFAARM